MDHWRDPSHLEAIVEGLTWLRSHYHEWGIASLAVPALGCGHGGLRWEDVRLALVRELAPLAVPVLIFGPGGKSAANGLAARLPLGSR
jgi:O-acetyl-ADP-ribose deacetylase (regulator of RNase III)